MAHSKRSTPRLLTVFLLMGLVGCSNGCEQQSLLSATAKANLSGTYCTSASAQHDVPLRIMIIVDTSESTLLTDPTQGRQQAAAALIGSFSPDADVKFSIITFDDFAVAATQDGAGQGIFTRDPAILADSLNQLTRQDGFTNYLAALEEATNTIQRDLVDTEEELAALKDMDPNANVELLRPYYFVIFLSDGIPRIRGAEQTTDEIVFKVERLLDVPEPALGLTLHTAFLGAEEDGDPTRRLKAMTLLQMMAVEGKGFFTNFESGEDIDFSLFKFEIKRLHESHQFLVYNRHAVLEELQIRVDSDADGLSDPYELELGSDPLTEDTDGDGMRDGYEEKIVEQSATESNPQCTTQPELDTDNDALRDCEEKFFGMDEQLFDTDADRFPDYLELFSGSSPIDPSDIRDNLDFDSSDTGQEIRERTDPDVSESEGQYRLYAYRYVEHRKEKVDDKNCYPFRVENVGLVKPQGTGPWAPGVNELVIEVVESPTDDPDNTSRLLRHTFEVSYDDVGSFRKPMDISLGTVDLETISEQTNQR